MYRINTTTNY